MNRKMALVFLSIGFSGCALAPPTLVATYEPQRQFGDVFRIIESQARKCWRRSVTPFRSGILVDSKITIQDKGLISLRRIDWGEGVVPKPFLEVQITPRKQMPPLVQVSEGPWAFGFTGRKILGYASHVEKWLKGDLRCER